MDDVCAATSRATGSRKLRIALVTETYLPEINGVAMTLGQLVRGLLQRRHDIELIRPRQYPAEVPAQREGFGEILMRSLAIPRYDALKLGLPSTQLLLRHWRVKRPDVVHLATEGPLGWSALHVALELGIPVASNFHTNFHTYSRHYGIGWLKGPITSYLRRFHNRALCTIVPTVELRNELQALGFANLLVIARGVDTTLFNPARRDPVLRETWRVLPGDPVAIYVGRVAPEKNLGLLFGAFDAMRAINPRTKLVVVGEGPERMNLVIRHPEAIFSGARIGTDLAAHYASADLFLHPSLTETYGNVTVEALASGLPVVAFRYAAAVQCIRDGANGITVPCGDHAAFIQAATGLLADADKRGRLGREAREKMIALDWSDIVSDFEDVLLRIAEGFTGEELATAVA